MTDDPAVNSLTPLLMKSYLFVDTDTAQHCTCSSNVKFEPLWRFLRTDHADDWADCTTWWRLSGVPKWDGVIRR